MNTEVITHPKRRDFPLWIKGREGGPFLAIGIDHQENKAWQPYEYSACFLFEVPCEIDGEESVTVESAAIIFGFEIKEFSKLKQAIIQDIPLCHCYYSSDKCYESPMVPYYRKEIFQCELQIASQWKDIDLEAPDVVKFGAGLEPFLHNPQI